jgi:hypothetical protein
MLSQKLPPPTHWLQKLQISQLPLSSNSAQQMAQVSLKVQGLIPSPLRLPLNAATRLEELPSEALEMASDPSGFSVVESRTEIVPESVFTTYVRLWP